MLTRSPGNCTCPTLPCDRHSRSCSPMVLLHTRPIEVSQQPLSSTGSRCVNGTNSESLWSRPLPPLLPSGAPVMRSPTCSSSQTRTESQPHLMEVTMKTKSSWRGTHDCTRQSHGPVTTVCSAANSTRYFCECASTAPTETAIGCGVPGGNTARSYSPSTAGMPRRHLPPCTPTSPTRSSVFRPHSPANETSVHPATGIDAVWGRGGEGLGKAWSASTTVWWFSSPAVVLVHRSLRYFFTAHCLVMRWSCASSIRHFMSLFHFSLCFR